LFNGGGGGFSGYGGGSTSMTITYYTDSKHYGTYVVPGTDISLREIIVTSEKHTVTINVGTLGISDSFNNGNSRGGERNYNDSYAKTQEDLIGKTYKLGTYGPNSFDCSAAVTTGIKKTINKNYVGIYNAPGLFNNFTHPTEKRERGILIFYDWTNDNSIDHVVTILNNQYMMHPSSSKGELIMVPLNYLDSYLQKGGGVLYYREINWPGWNGN
jgi:hypothetical protein